jgi:hypothetical protein
MIDLPPAEQSFQPPTDQREARVRATAWDKREEATRNDTYQPRLLRSTLKNSNMATPPAADSHIEVTSWLVSTIL